MTRWISLAILLLIIGLGYAYVYTSRLNKPQESAEENQNVAKANFAEWQEFTAPLGQFKVLLPNLPHHATEAYRELKSNEMRQYDLFVSSKEDGTLFTVYLISFPEKKTFKSDPDYLTNFIKEMLNSNPNNKIKSIKSVPYKKGSAVDFNVENQDATIEGKAFMKDNTVYVLSTTSKNENRNKKEFDFFINSFELGAKQQQQPQQPQLQPSK